MLRLDQALEALEDDERYRAAPDRSHIDRWAIETHQAVWKRLAEAPAAS